MVKTVENERKYDILRMLVNEYVDTAEPVGSEGLCASYKLSWSPATVRNEFSVLEAEGYITKPHTSGGRIPTNNAYRKMRDELLEEEQQSIVPRWDPFSMAKISRAYIHASHDAFSDAARMLADVTDHLVIAGIPTEDELAEFGLPKLVREPEFADQEVIAGVATFIERMATETEHTVKKLLHDELGIFIGEENPYSEIQSCSLLITGFKTLEGESGFIGILGPTRMRYDRNIAFLEQVANALGNHQ